MVGVNYYNDQGIPLDRSQLLKLVPNIILGDPSLRGTLTFKEMPSDCCPLSDATPHPSVKGAESIKVGMATSSTTINKDGKVRELV